MSAICAQLHRAYRDLRLYPSEHPTALQTLGKLVEMLISYVGTHGTLSLDVEENRLLYDDEPVYAHETSHDNLAFLMFRDGVRSLSFHSGLEVSEVEALTDCLAHVDDFTKDDHDLVTRLWEQDFAHIDYRVADPFLGGGVLWEGTIDALRETVLRRLDEVTLPDRLNGNVPVGDLQVVQPMQIDLESLGLSPQEVGQSEQVAVDPSNVLHDFLVVLLEVAGRYPETFDDSGPLTHALVTVIDSYMDDRNLEGLDFALRQLQLLETQGRCAAGLAGLVLSRAVTIERLGNLLAGSGQEASERATDTEKFLTAVRPWIIPVLLETLTVTQDRAVRKSLLAVLQAEGGVSGSHLAPLLQDARWYVVRNAVQLAAGMRSPELVGPLERLLRHPDVRVRREVIRTLDSFGEGPALPVLAKALEDEDSSVRTLAARSLGRRGGWEQEALVRACVEGRDFYDRPAEEIEAFLVALAELGKDRAVPLLDTLWRRRLFATRPAPVRAAAIVALGIIPTPGARAVLSEAARSGDSQLRRLASRALQESQSPGSRGQA